MKAVKQIIPYDPGHVVKLIITLQNRVCRVKSNHLPHLPGRAISDQGKKEHRKQQPNRQVLALGSNINQSWQGHMHHRNDQQPNKSLIN